MERRAFLRLLGLGTAAVATGTAGLDLFALDPERALWVPGQRRIFDLGASPLLDEAMSVDWITRETLRLLQSQLQMEHWVNRQWQAFPVGDTVRVRAPKWSH